MRQLKFRLCFVAQDGSKSITYPTDNRDSWDKKYRINLNGTILEDYGRTGEECWEEPFDYPAPPFLQQFTGLKDENGKDIYEGDVVKSTWKENQPYSYDPEEVMEKENVQTIKYKAPTFVIFSPCYEQTVIEEFKRIVIGNIFENPELFSDPD